jgi:excisionase family DNA binding protein
MMAVGFPFRERITCTVAEACIATGLGRTKLYELIKLKKVAASKVGARTLIDVRSLVSAVGAPQDRAGHSSANTDASVDGAAS